MSGYLKNIFIPRFQNIKSLLLQNHDENKTAFRIKFLNSYMIRTIIIDDEQHCINLLQNMLQEHCKSTVHVMDSFKTADEGVHAIKKYNPELVFLDVQLGNKTGFDVLQQVDTNSFETIFTTAYEKYAVQAFKFSALDYLLKPVSSDDLKQAVMKLSGKTPDIRNGQKMQTLLGNLHSREKKICIPVISGLVVLNVSDIIRCESNINYTTIFTIDKQKLIVAKGLKEFEQMLSGFNFFRLHNSHLVNLAFIRSYNKGKGGFVVLSDGKEIEVSVRRKDEFLKRLAQL